MKTADFQSAEVYFNFKVTSEETIGKTIYDIGNGQWNIPQLKLLLEETLSKNQEFHDYKVSYNFPNIGEKVMLLNGIKVKEDNYLTLLVISDITGREKAFTDLKKVYESIEKMNKYMVGREVKMVELKAEIERLKITISETLPKSDTNP